MNWQIDFLIKVEDCTSKSSGGSFDFDMVIKGPYGEKTLTKTESWRHQNEEHFIENYTIQLSDDEEIKEVNDNDIRNLGCLCYD